MTMPIGTFDTYAARGLREDLADVIYRIDPTDVPFTSNDLGATLAQSGVWNQHTAGRAGSPTSVNVGRTGRYVRVQLSGTNYLTLAEVQVIGQ